MKQKFVFFMTVYILLFSFIKGKSVKEGQVEIEVELEIIKDLSVEVTPMHFGDCMPGATNIEATSNIEIEGEAGRWVLVKFFDRNNISNEGYIELINQADNSKKQRVNLRLQSSNDGYLYINNGEVRDNIIGSIDRVVDNPGYYEGFAVVKVRYN